MKHLLFHVFLISAVFYSGCKSDSVSNKIEAKKERHFFDEYKDTVISLAAINSELNASFNTQNLGKPIGVSGTDNWLITIGGWYINDRNILVQGAAFKKGNRFFPKPLRNTEVEFKGPFNGLIGFSQAAQKYTWVIPPEETYEGLKYQRTKNYHLLIIEESEGGLVFTEIVSGKKLKIEAKNALIEWSVAELTDEIVLLEKHGITTHSIESLLKKS